MRLLAECMVDQALLCGAPWKGMTELYFEEYPKNPTKTFLKILFLFLLIFPTYFLTLGAVNVKTLIYPHYKNYQKHLLLVAKNREGIYTKEDVQKLCKDDQLDYVFIEYMLI